MNQRLFTYNQIESLLKKENFLRFVNEYFSSFRINKYSMNVSISDSDLKQEELLLRLFLSNLEKLRKILSRLEINMSYSYNDYKVNSKGMVTGRLDVNQYIKSKGIYSYPRNYPCVVKRKAYLTPENLFCSFLVTKVISFLRSFRKKCTDTSFTKSTEYNEVVRYEHYFRDKIMSEKFSDSSQYLFLNIDEIYEKEIVQAFLKRLNNKQMSDLQGYKDLFDWYESFLRNDGLSFVDKTSGIFYDESFSDKLFELWVLFSINETLIDSYKCNLIEKNNLSERGEKCIFSLKTSTGKMIDIYFQKGKSIYWDDKTPTKWFYAKSDNHQINTNLTGIPDISIVYYDKDSSHTYLIDVKNRIRNKGENSDEIYKMIGYKDNFSIFSNKKNNNKFLCSLVYRNDNLPFEEKIKTENNDCIQTISVSTEDDEKVNNKQLKLLCKQIMNCFENEYELTQIITTDIVNFPGSDNEDYIISEKVDQNIRDLFHTNDMQKKLSAIRLRLERDHFPSVWRKFSNKVKDTLAMAETVFDLIGTHKNIDYAPVAVEFCRALEIAMNEQIFDPFKKRYDIKNLNRNNNLYKKYTFNRDSTLGEMVFGLKHSLPSPSNKNPMVELKNYIDNNIDNHFQLYQSLNKLEKINVEYRRKSAHTDILGIDAILRCRELLLGIETSSLFTFIY